MRSRITHTAVILGVTIGVYFFAFTFLVVNYLPQIFGILIIIGALVIPIVALWPSRFDADLSVKWPMRLGHRLLVVMGGSVVAAVVSLLIVLAVPPFTVWSENQHRESLRSHGVAETEIEQQIVAHRPTTIGHLRDGAFGVAMPGTIAALFTTVAGAVMFRRRRTP